MSEDSGVVVFEGFGGGAEYLGPVLTSWQYEALCRHALSREYGIPLTSIKTGFYPSTSGATRHQLNLYWTSSDGVCEFLCFANAKFYKKPVDLEEVMTLMGVQQEIRAHKAMLITNTGFTSSCEALARQNGVGLFIVRPAVDLDPSPLPRSSAVRGAAEKMETAFHRRISPAYRMGVVHRGFDGAGVGRKIEGVDGIESGASPELGGGVDSSLVDGPADDFVSGIEMGVLAEDSIENAMMEESQVMNRMMGNDDGGAEPGDSPPFGIRTK